MYDWYELYGDCHPPYAGALVNEASKDVDSYPPWEKDSEDPNHFVTSSGKIIPRCAWLSRVSKQMSWVLRHRAGALGLSLRPDGGVPVAELLALQKIRQLRVSLCHIEEIVNENKKGRFTMWDEAGLLFIRANQGHSIAGIEDAYLLEEIYEPLEICCHGTYLSNWKAIAEKGLHLMGRNHIHFTAGDPADFNSPPDVGMRADAELFIYVDMAKAMAAGIQFFYSANGVVLTRGDYSGEVPPSMFKKVVSASGSLMYSAPEDVSTSEAITNDAHPGCRATQRSRRSSVTSTTEFIPLINTWDDIPLQDSRSSTTDTDDVSTSASTSPVSNAKKGPKARRSSQSNKNNSRQSEAYCGGVMWNGDVGYQMQNGWWHQEYEQYDFSNQYWGLAFF